MKEQIQKIGVLTVIFLLSTQLVSAQKADTSTSRPSSPMYDLYMRRHKTFNTVGWVLLAPGAAVMVIGFTYHADPNAFLDFTGPALAGIGAIVTLTSIPFFISAGSNARKARRASLQLKNGYVPGTSGFNYAAVSLTIRL